jgi:hypothetical protein
MYNDNVIRIISKEFARGFPGFSQTCVKHDLRKNKIVVYFFANKLIFMS